MEISVQSIIYEVYVYNYLKRQKMPKRIKRFTWKWQRKLQHFFIHPFRSLQCIGFVEKNFFVMNKLSRAYLMWGRGWGLNFQLCTLPVYANYFYDTSVIFSNSIITYSEPFTICIGHDRQTDVIGIDCPSGAPWNFNWTKVAHAQLGYGAYNIRP